MKDDPIRGNHSVHYTLLQHDILKDLKGRSLMTTWLVWCYIMHWNWSRGECTLPQGKLAKAWKCHNSYIKSAVDHLTKHKMIRCIEAPSYKYNKSGVYKTLQACIEISNNLYRKQRKPVASGAQPVAQSINHNNSNKRELLLSKDSGNDSSFIKESSPSSEQSYRPDFDNMTLQEAIAWRKTLEKQKEKNNYN